MRRIVEEQPGLAMPGRVDHEHAREWAEISDILDEQPELVELVHGDLVADRSGKTGRPAKMSAEQTLRAAIVRRVVGFTFDQLAFHLADSRTYRSFCRFGVLTDSTPRSSALHDSIRRISAETWEAVNRVLVRGAKKDGIESGQRVRVDSTVTETDIHPPSDSWLLWDSVRVLTRLMKRAALIVPVKTVDHTKRARRRHVGIATAKRKAQRRGKYIDLLKVTRRTVTYADAAARRLAEVPEGIALAEQLHHFVALAKQVMDQTRRRVLDGESVPASDKVVSIFEPHTDILHKGGRRTEFGHKVCLAIGQSSLVLDCSVEVGVHGDATLTTKMIERQRDLYGVVPTEAAFDGGFSSNDNLTALKAMGVTEVMFHKRGGISDISKMTSTPALHRVLWRFRAGVEGCISWLKRCFGLRRANWRGLAGFKRYVWSSVVAANLLVLARRRLRPAT